MYYYFVNPKNIAKVSNKNIGLGFLNSPNCKNWQLPYSNGSVAWLLPSNSILLSQLTLWVLLIFWRKIWTKSEEVEIFSTIAYNIKEYWRFIYFSIFFISPNLCWRIYSICNSQKIPNGAFLIYNHGSQKLKRNHITTFITSSLLSNSFIKIARGIWHSWN